MKYLIIKADNAEQASAIYSAKRDKSGQGASTFPEGKWNEYHISYNGRIWTGPEAWRNERPVFDPSGAA